MKKIFYSLSLALTLICVDVSAQRTLNQTTSNLTWIESGAGSGTGWSKGTVPTNGDSIVIKHAVTVNFPSDKSFNVGTTSGASVYLRIVAGGSLTFNNASSSSETFTLPAGSAVYVMSGSTLTCTNPTAATPDIARISGSVNNFYTSTQGEIFGPSFSTGNPLSSGSGAPLPVKFSNIKASEKGTGVQIDWTSYSELNLANYQIERSADGVNYTSIGEVAPRNISAETQYGFYDALPLSGISFYRIRNNDIDGKSGLSNIVKVNLNKNIKSIGVYPNPVIGNRVSFQTSDLTKGIYQVEVINSMGARVYQLSVNHAGGAINQSLNLPTLQSGQYTLRINGTSTSSIHKITILQ